MLWRIIRINGDETIRMIYQGNTSAIGTRTQIGTSAYNSNYDNNMYVGFMYQSGLNHGIKTSSTIKGELDKWYDSKLSNYSSYIDINAGFCGDRTFKSGTGIGTTTTSYAGNYRLQTNKIPTLKCRDKKMTYSQ